MNTIIIRSNFRNKLLIFCLLLQLATVRVFAQSNPMLQRFSVSKFESKVFISWTIVQGSTCDGIKIYRSGNGKDFVEIEKIYGICGNISEPQNYDFTDNNPIENKVNYYRLEFGSGNFSQIVSVALIGKKDRGYQLHPNPSNTEVKINFNNKTKQETQLFIFNDKGMEVLNTTGSDDYFILNTLDWPSGLYFFSISELGMPSIIFGKLLVRH